MLSNAVPPEFTPLPRLKTSPSRKPYRRTPFHPIPAPSSAVPMAPLPPSKASMSPPAPRLEQNEFEPSPTLSSSAFSPTLSSATFSPTPSFDSVFSASSSPALSMSSFGSSPSSSPSLGSSGFPSPAPASVDWGVGLGLVASPVDAPILAPTVYQKPAPRTRPCAESTIHVCRLRLKGFEDMVMVAGEEARRSRVKAKARREKRRRDQVDE